MTRPAQVDPRAQCLFVVAPAEARPSVHLARDQVVKGQRRLPPAQRAASDATGHGEAPFAWSVEFTSGLVRITESWQMHGPSLRSGYEPRFSKGPCRRCADTGGLLPGTDGRGRDLGRVRRQRAARVQHLALRLPGLHHVSFRSVLRRCGLAPVVLQYLTRAETLLDTKAGGFQARLWHRPIRLPPAVTAAETLVRFGYLEADGLAGLCRAMPGLA